MQPGSWARRARRISGLAVLCGVASAVVVAPPAEATTQTFNYTGGEQEFIVPTGVHVIGVTAFGGGGGASGTKTGGEGAQVTGILTVTPGETLFVEVGGNGKSEGEGGAGGFNGGGNGGGGGGGASDLRTAPRSTSLTVEDTRLLVAAGGGGAGATGGEEGGNGGNAGEQGGASSYEGGHAGTQIEGGEGAFGCVNSGGNGQLGLGGAGGYAAEATGPGGGGGGGLYGGGGGAGACYVGSSGGGGGSSLVPEGGIAGTSAAAPKIEISYTPPPGIDIGSPTDGATYAQGQTVNAAYVCLANEGVGLKSCAGPVASGAAIDTVTPGEHTFTVNAEDNKAGQAAESVTYTVIASPSVEITAPANGATYTQGQAVTASYACHAAEGATLKSCHGSASSGAALDTSSLGQHTFDVDAEDNLGGKASREVAYTVVSPPVVSPPVPNTALQSHPKKTIKTKKKKTKVRFSFSSESTGATFKCKLDGGAFAPCSSPKTYKVKLGKHVFSVEAVGAGGTDPTPATFKFKVKKK